MFMHAIKYPGAKIICVTLTNAMSRNVNQAGFIELFEKTGLIKAHNRSLSEIHMINDSLIMFKSVPDTAAIQRVAQGYEASMIVLDEVCSLPDDTYKYAKGRLRQKVYDEEGNLADNKFIMVGTPRMGFIKNLLDENEHIFRLTGITTRSNINLPEDYIQDLELEYSGQFKEQELMGQFVNFTGLIININIVEEAPKKFHQIIYGIDIGWTNPTAIMVLGRYSDKWYFVDEVYKTKLNDAAVVEELKFLIDRWGKGMVYVDPEDPKVREEIIKSGIQAKPAYNKVNPGNRQVNNMFTTKQLYVVDNCKNYIKESYTYTYKSGTDEVLKGSPNHALDAGRYAITGIKLNSKPNFIIR